MLVCSHCWLVQTQDFARADELFTADYAYFSGISTSWLAHAERYVTAMTERFRLGPGSHVVEIAANDGYLLQYVKARGIRCTGIEPTHGTAEAARAKGIPIVEAFFVVALAEQLANQDQQADLLAHLIEQQRAGRRIAAYGAAAKGNTLLNYAGIKPDLLPYVCDAAPAKQGQYLPGSHIPIRPPAALRDEPLDEVLILPWNIAEEAKAQLSDLAEQGVRFVTAVPKLSVD